MGVDPDLTSGIIPALAGLQILGFAVVAVVSLLGNQKQSDASEPGSVSGSPSKSWLLSLFAGLAMISLFRAALVLAYWRVTGGTSTRYLSLLPEPL
jgi:hypothetical protein